MLPGQVAWGCSQPLKHLQNPPPKKVGESWSAPQQGQEPDTGAWPRQGACQAPGTASPQGSTALGDQVNGSYPGDSHNRFGRMETGHHEDRATASVIVKMELVPWLVTGRAQERPQPEQGQAPALVLAVWGLLLGCCCCWAAPDSHQHPQPPTGSELHPMGLSPCRTLPPPPPPDPPSAQPQSAAVLGGDSPALSGFKALWGIGCGFQPHSSAGSSSPRRGWQSQAARSVPQSLQQAQLLQGNCLSP